MNELMVNNVSLPILEWNGERVISFKDVDRIHERVLGTTSRNFHRNIEHMILGKDYYKLSMNEIRSLNINSKYIYPKGLTVLTRSGYLMIVKSLKDDRAWEIQKQLVNAYFILEKVIENGLKNSRENNDKDKNGMEKSNSKYLTSERNLKIIEEDNIKLDMHGLINCQKELFELEVKSNESFRNTIMNSFEKMIQLVMLQSKMISKQYNMIDRLLSFNSLDQNNDNDENNTIVTQIDTENTSKESIQKDGSKHKNKSKLVSSDFIAWKGKIHDILIGFDKNQILNYAYNYMQKHYGICWEQEIKDYIALYNTKPKSSLELIYFMEKDNFVLKNLFEGCLDSVCKLHKKDKQEVVYPVHNVREMQTLADYIGIKLNDKSPNHSNVWKYFFKDAHKKNPNAEKTLKEYDSKYREAYDISKGMRVSKIDLIKTYSRLQNFYIPSFNTWVKEKYYDIVNDILYENS